jgi:hypothetical protein
VVGHVKPEPCLGGKSLTGIALTILRSSNLVEELVGAESRTKCRSDSEMLDVLHQEIFSS